MRILNKIFTGIIAVAACCTALYFLFLYSLPNIVDLNKYKDSFFSEFRNQTGFKVICENASIKKSYTPGLKIHLFHTIIFYPDGQIFLKIREADLNLKVVPLFFKRLAFNEIVLTRPVINLSLYKDLSISSDKFFLNDKNVNTKGFVLNDISSGIICNNYKINIKDETSGKNFYSEGDKFVLSTFSGGKKIRFVTSGALYSNDEKYIDYDTDIISDTLSFKQRMKFSPFKTIYDSDIHARIYSHLKTDTKNNIFGDLKIENLSLKAGKTVMKNNNILLAFKGGEFDSDAILHTSADDSVVLKGKVKYGNKKYAQINAVANNINISNLSMLINEILPLFNIKNPFADLKISGFADVDFNFSSDFKKLTSSGHAKIKNTVISHKSLPYSVTDINTDINFDNNKILIENAFAKVNNTPLVISGVINEDVSYDLNAVSENLDIVNLLKLFASDLNLPVSVLKGKLSFDVNLKGIADKQYSLDGVIKSQNLKLLDKKASVPFSVSEFIVSGKGDNKKYSGDITAKDFYALINNEKYSVDSFTASFDEKDIIIPENKISKPFEVNFEGKIADFLTSPSANITFGSDIDSAILYKLLGGFIKLPAKPSGKIKMSGSLNFKDRIINLKSRLYADSANYISYSVIHELLNKPSYLNIDLSLNNDIIDIKDIGLYNNAGNKPEKIISLNGRMNCENEILLKNVKVSTGESVSAGSDFFGGEEISFKADAVLNGKLSSPDASGNIKIKRFLLKKFHTDIKNADILFNSDNIKLTAPDIVIENSDFNISADIMADLKKIIVNDIKVYSRNLDLNSLFSLEKNADLTSEIPLIVKKGTAVINNFSLANLKAGDISSDFSFDKNILHISNISANAYGGNISGSADYNFTSRLFKSVLNGKYADIKYSLYDLCAFDDNLTGRTDFSSDISFLAGNYDTVIKTLAGSLKFNAKNGKAGTLGKFEYYLSAQNILYHGIFNSGINRIKDAVLSDDTAQYRQASGEISFKDGYMYTDNVKTSGNKMSLYVKGRYNMLTGLANIDIFGRISDEIKYKLGSLSDSSSKSKKEKFVLKVPYEIIAEIPELYNKPEDKSNTFKVNINGDINSVGSINSFTWIVASSSDISSESGNRERLFDETSEDVSQNNEKINNDNTDTASDSEKNTDLPDFSDIGI